MTAARRSSRVYTATFHDGLKMKHHLPLLAALLALGTSITAQAACDRYPDATLTLNTATTISVPDSIPVGGVILRQAFNGTSPGFTTHCWGQTLRTITGRYARDLYPGTLIYRTEVPGIGITVSMTWADGGPANFGLSSQSTVMYPGKVQSFTSAQVTFYKMGTVADGTIPSGSLWEDRWHNVPESFRLVFGNAIRFIRAPATCDLAAGDVNRLITLAPINVGDLKDAPYAGVQNFDLTANCTDAGSVTFRFTGTPAPDNTALFANTGTAQGIGLWLYSRINGVPQTISVNDQRTVTVSGDRAVLPLSAAYHKNGRVSPGTLASTATVSITYN